MPPLFRALKGRGLADGPRPPIEALLVKPVDVSAAQTWTVAAALHQTGEETCWSSSPGDLQWKRRKRRRRFYTVSLSIIHQKFNLPLSKKKNLIVVVTVCHQFTDALTVNRNKGGERKEKHIHTHTQQCVVKVQ